MPYPDAFYTHAPPQVRTGRLGTQEALARPLLPEGGPRARLRRHGLVVPVSASACAAPCLGVPGGSAHLILHPARSASPRGIPSRAQCTFHSLEHHGNVPCFQLWTFMPAAALAGLRALTAERTHSSPLRMYLEVELRGQR